MMHDRIRRNAPPTAALVARAEALAVDLNVMEERTEQEMRKKLRNEERSYGTHRKYVRRDALNG